jgi:hypothetical protein
MPAGRFWKISNRSDAASASWRFEATPFFGRRKTVGRARIAPVFYFVLPLATGGTAGWGVTFLTFRDGRMCGIPAMGSPKLTK